MEFKKLEVQPEKSGIKETIQSAHFRKSLLYIVLGALAGFGFYFFGEGLTFQEVVFSDSLGSVFMGAFLGFFLTNSPCARNRC